MCLFFGFLFRVIGGLRIEFFNRIWVAPVTL